MLSSAPFSLFSWKIQKNDKGKKKNNNQKIKTLWEINLKNHKKKPSDSKISTREMRSATSLGERSGIEKAGEE